MGCNEWKINFQIFAILVFKIWSFFYLKLQISMNFQYKIDQNSKNENRKNLKHNFSVDSTLWAPFMKIGPLLRGGVGLHILSWEKSKRSIGFPMQTLGLLKTLQLQSSVFLNKTQRWFLKKASDVGFWKSNAALIS